jgi:hypothetical protein
MRLRRLSHGERHTRRCRAGDESNRLLMAFPRPSLERIPVESTRFHVIAGLDLA